MRVRPGLKRWLLATTGLVSFAACSDGPSTSADEQTDEGSQGGSAGQGVGAGGTAASGGRSGVGGASVGGSTSPTGGESSLGGGAGASGASGASGTGGETSVCGDGESEGDEVCDDGFDDGCGSCNADCSGVGAGSACDDAEFCEETELGVCDCRLRPVGGKADGIIRFVALGDGGEGNATQFKVAHAVDVECEQRGGCDFAVYLGDNIYPVGASSATDPQFQSKFELPYCRLAFPFYVVLGNHDYGNVAPPDEAKAAAQLAYSGLSTKWKLPDHNYTIPLAEGSSSLELFALDTMRLQFGVDNALQASWLTDAVNASSATWKLALGHHPYVSNGSHGNAGNYEGSSVNPITSGLNIETFFDDSVCGAVDLYLSGHDHNRQWLEAGCGLEAVVSGTASKATALVGRDGNTTYFEDDAGGGFAVFEIDGETLTGWFYDEDGNEEFTRAMTK
jgi:tartrate-resistant acid phosphatase type 5